METVADGTLKYKVVGGEHDGAVLEMNATLVKMCAETLYKKHGMEPKFEDVQVVGDDGVQRVDTGGPFLEATPGFVSDLANALRDQCGYECTPAVALKAWQDSCVWWEDTQKKTSELLNSASGTDSTSET